MTIKRQDVVAYLETSRAMLLVVDNRDVPSSREVNSKGNAFGRKWWTKGSEGGRGRGGKWRTSRSICMAWQPLQRTALRSTPARRLHAMGTSTEPSSLAEADGALLGGVTTWMTRCLSTFWRQRLAGGEGWAYHTLHGCYSEPCIWHTIFPCRILNYVMWQGT